MKKYKSKVVVTAHEKGKDYLKHYGEGLFLRVRASGAQSWLFSYQLPGSSRKFRMTLKGKSLTLKEARAMLPELHALVSRGIDPKIPFLKDVKISIPRIKSKEFEYTDIDSISIGPRLDFFAAKLAIEQILSEEGLSPEMIKKIVIKKSDRPYQ